VRKPEGGVEATDRLVSVMFQGLRNHLLHLGECLLDQFEAVYLSKRIIKKRA